MEKWKIVVIILLLGGLLGYGFYQQAPRPQVPIEAPNTTPKPEPPVIPAGQPMPKWDIPQEFWANTPKPITPADVKGSVTLIEFWRAGCSHCEEAAPFMESLYKQYSARGLKMVTFHSPAKSSGPDSEEGNWGRVQTTIKKWGITYPVAFDKDGHFFASIGGDTYPTVILLNREGLVEHSAVGHTPAKAQALAAQIEALLKK